MTDSGSSLAWLPPVLFAAGVFSLISGLLSDGPDRVGGIVFGVVSLAAFAAILHRRKLDGKTN